MDLKHIISAFTPILDHYRGIRALHGYAGYPPRAEFKSRFANIDYGRGISAILIGKTYVLLSDL